MVNILYKIISFFINLCYLYYGGNDMRQKDIIKNIDFNKLFLAVILTIMIIFAVSLIPKKKQNYPHIVIDRVSLEENKDNGLVNKLIYTNDNIWYYDTYEVEVCNKDLICYGLINALNHKQITVEELKSYYEELSKNNEAGMVVLNDGGTTIYTHKTHTVIFCNTINNNKDIYYGPTDLTDKLKSVYCNHDTSKRNYFIRTYRVLNIIPSKDNAYNDITISQFQGETEIVRIPSTYALEEDKTYEFTFYTYNTFDDTIDNIFTNATLSSIKETDKVGLDQLQEKIIITKD